MNAPLSLFPRMLACLIRAGYFFPLSSYALNMPARYRMVVSKILRKYGIKNGVHRLSEDFAHLTVSVVWEMVKSM